MLRRSEGQGALTHGKVNGKTWAWPAAFKADGKSFRVDGRVTEVSADSWTTKVVLTVDGGTPTTVSEGTATRVPSPELAPIPGTTLR